jgi:hypothetical protein
VLLREYFGRGHQRHLMTRLDRLTRRQRRDDRLAATDITLQQSFASAGLRQIAGDLGGDPALRGGQGEGQRTLEAAAPAARSPAGREPRCRRRAR